MNRLAWGLLIAGVAVGAIAAIGSAAAHTSATWAGLAATAAGLMTASLLVTLELQRPGRPAAPPGPPRIVERLSDAEQGDSLARQYVLERLDALRAEHRAGGLTSRLSDDPALYALPGTDFLRVVDRVVGEEEARP